MQSGQRGGAGAPRRWLQTLLVVGTVALACGLVGTGTDDETPGFGALLAILAVAGAALARDRRGR